MTTLNTTAFLTVLMLMAGCRGTAGSGPSSRAAAQSDATDPMFLGVAENQSQEFPQDSAFHGIDRITKVEIRPYAEYLEARNCAKVANELRRGQWQYWARESDRHVPFNNGTSAMITIIDRFKSPMPTTSDKCPR